MQIHFNNGTQTEKVEVEYPIGHRRRRQEGIPELVKKFADNLQTRFPGKQVVAIQELCADQKQLKNTAANEFMSMFVI